MYGECAMTRTRILCIFYTCPKKQQKKKIQKHDGLTTWACPFLHTFHTHQCRSKKVLRITQTDNPISDTFSLLYFRPTKTHCLFPSDAPKPHTLLVKNKKMKTLRPETQKSLLNPILFHLEILSGSQKNPTKGGAYCKTTNKRGVVYFALKTLKPPKSTW